MPKNLQSQVNLNHKNDHFIILQPFVYNLSKQEILLNTNLFSNLYD